MDIWHIVKITTNLALKRVKEWVQHLSLRRGSRPSQKGPGQKDSGDSPWSTFKVRGPCRDDTDVINCGVYVSYVLEKWSQGKEVSAESYVDPMKYRMEIYEELRKLPTTPGVPKIGEGKIASDSSPLSSASSFVQGTIVEPMTQCGAKLIRFRSHRRGVPNKPR